MNLTLDQDPVRADTICESDCELLGRSSQSIEAIQERLKKTKPIRTAFLLTSMPVGGAETLLVNLVRGFNSEIIKPQIVCLKERGPLGEEIAADFPVASRFIASKWDVCVVERLRRHFVRDQIDAVVTVGAGDKMFWGRIAAKLARVPVICSALHSTGWPDGVGKANRLLTKITDAFIAVAQSHGKFLVDFERFPESKVTVIPNGINTERFRPDLEVRSRVRRELNLPATAPVIGIVAALRPEKNHEMFVEVAARVQRVVRDSQFLIIGEGPERAKIEAAIEKHSLQYQVQMLGNRSDTHRLLSAIDVFALTSHNEANPVSILEALSTEVPVVSTRVGSIAETVIDGETGYCVDPGDAESMAERIQGLILDSKKHATIGEKGRQRVQKYGSLQSMVAGYEELISRIYKSKKSR
jgi:glycosyltransferase involved in cell wall biosynthesis